MHTLDVRGCGPRAAARLAAAVCLAACALLACHEQLPGPSGSTEDPEDVFGRAPCADPGDERASRTYGDAGGQRLPVLVEATPGAPDDAVYLLAWTEGTTIFVRHVDYVGAPVGDGEEITVEVDELTSLDIVATADGYFAAATSQSGILGLRALHYAQLDAQGTLVPGSSTTASRFTGPIEVELAAGEDNILMIWTEFRLSFSHAIVRCVFPANSPAVCEDSDNHSDVVTELDEPPALAVAPSDDLFDERLFALAWYERTAPAQLRAATVEPDGSLGTFTTVAGDAGPPAPEARLDIAWTSSTEYAVVGPVRGAPDGSDARLTLGIVDTATEDLTVREDLTDSDGVSRPAVDTVGARLLVGYRRDDALYTGAGRVDDPGRLTERSIAELAPDAATDLALAAADISAALAWIAPEQGGRLHFVPLDFAGQPLCPAE